MSAPPFRSQRGRRVAIVAAVVSVLVFSVLAAAMPATGMTGWGVADSVLLAALGVAIAALMWRYASIRAVPDPGGLVVRNLLLTRRVAWSQVEAVRFADGDPWVTLVLDDGDELAVMAVQRVDGATGAREAARLRALVAEHGV
ncbi:MAG: PH domain-containing protein [Angustibacter sp.]